jgi:hypothetical protein
MTLLERLERIEGMLAVIAGQQQVKEWLSTSEFAMQVGRAEFTVREWARRGRILARKKKSGRAGHTAWAISREELQRYQREGLLPVS